MGARYDPHDAANVLETMARGGKTRGQLARECGVDEAALSHWPGVRAGVGGRGIRMPLLTTRCCGWVLWSARYLDLARFDAAF